MKQTSEIIIQAPLIKVFSAASDLARWPEFLPHYRYNRFLAHKPSGGLVKMSSIRYGIAATWLAEYRIDTQKHQLSFLHLKSTFNATLGMKVVWTFKQLSNDSVKVTIVHDLPKKRLFIRPEITDWILVKFFIHENAAKTLSGLKRKVEAKSLLPVLAIK